MINLRDIEKAKESIRHLIKKTPLIRSQFLSNLYCRTVYLKLENQQIGNSFKIRGALNKMAHLSTEQSERGIITASTGNHAIAIANCAETLGINAKIVIPKNIPKTKIDMIRKYNIELSVYGDTQHKAEQKAKEIAKKEGMTYISPYNDEMVIAGQGTLGLEILEDLPRVNTIVVPVGGGGLISGISIAAKSIKPNVNIIGVQSEASPVMYESLHAGRIVDVNLKESIADGLHGGIDKGSITFDIIQAYVDNLLLVKENIIRKAIYLLWMKEKQIVEGAGAIAIAPILENNEKLKGKTVVAVISGGNIDKKRLQNMKIS